MLRALGILLVLCAPAAHAQLGEKLRGWVEVDAHAAPDHDTAYIAQYRSNLTLSAVSKYQLSGINMVPTEGDELTFSTNNRTQYGLGLDYKWLSVEALFNVPGWSDHDPELGGTTSRGLGVGLTKRRLWARGIWNSTQGYYMEESLRWTGSERPYVRPDLLNRTFMLSVNYALGGKLRYSQNAALFQMERQKKSAGTWVLGGTAWHTTVTADSSLLAPALLDTFRLATGFTGVQRLMLGATIGYTHSFVFWHKGFIQASLLPGVAYAEQWIDIPGERLHGKGAAAVVEFKAGAGFNGDCWYTALTVSTYHASANIADELQLAMDHTSVRLALGIRFGDPGIKALHKVGL